MRKYRHVGMFLRRWMKSIRKVTDCFESCSHRQALVAGIALGIVGMNAVLAAPFTYQGRLVDDGAPANGPYELRFRLLDQLEGGAQAGPTLLFTNVPVAAGVFTVPLDFGSGVFTGNARWLEMAARSVGSTGALVVLAPRQPIQAVPYAQFSFSGSGDASQLTSGFLPDARLSANIARGSQLGASSNALSARIDALSARVEALTAALGAVSNRVGTNVLSGGTLVSADPADPAYLAQGLVPFHRVASAGWMSGATAGEPAARKGAPAVWTGQRMLVWGGELGAGLLSGNGSEYDPVADRWTLLSALNTPASRRGFSAVWLGNALAVWGGRSASFLGDGALYSVETGNWTAIAAAGAPAAREGHGAVWTEARMVVWGGRNAIGLLSDGSVYDPVTMIWTALPALGSPTARSGATVAWGGGRMMVWGGLGETGGMGTGAVIPFAGGTTAGAWSAMSTVSAPSPREKHAAVWTGSRWIVWGGRGASGALSTGASYDPAANAWVTLPTLGAPSARWDHALVWTGREMVVLGGQSEAGELSDGAIFDPARGVWRPLPGAGNSVARSGAAAVWTGSEVLVFGGEASGQALSALRRLNPEPDWYFYRKP
jgi:hypothetical protein